MSQDFFEAREMPGVIHPDLKSVIHRVITVLLAIFLVRNEILDEFLNLYVSGGRVEHDAHQEIIQIEQGVASLSVDAVLYIRTVIDPRVRNSRHFCHAEIYDHRLQTLVGSLVHFTVDVDTNVLDGNFPDEYVSTV